MEKSEFGQSVVNAIREKYDEDNDGFISKEGVLLIPASSQTQNIVVRAWSNHVSIVYINRVRQERRQYS